MSRKDSHRLGQPLKPDSQRTPVSGAKPARRGIRVVVYPVGGFVPKTHLGTELKGGAGEAFTAIPAHPAGRVAAVSEAAKTPVQEILRGVLTDRGVVEHDPRTKRIIQFAGAVDQRHAQPRDPPLQLWVGQHRDDPRGFVPPQALEGRAVRRLELKVPGFERPGETADPADQASGVNVGQWHDQGDRYRLVVFAHDITIIT